MKKFISAIIATVLTVTITSCTAEAPHLLNFIDNNEEYTPDFSGRTIIFGLRSFGEGDLIIPETTTNTLEADEQRAKVNNIKKLLNCNIEQKIQEDSSVIVGAIASQSTDIDIYYGASYDQSQWCKAGILHDFRENDVIDITDESRWGTEKRQQAMTYKGIVFGILPQNAIGISDATGIILTNDHKINSFAQPTPKELLENGNWTFDYFKDYVVSVSDMNASTPIYGMTIARSQEYILPLTAALANGSSMLKPTDEGNYEFTLGKDPKAVYALDWISEVYQTGVIADDNYNDTFSGYFSNGLTSLYIGTTGVGTANLDGFPLRELNEGFSFISFPYGPDAEYGKTNSTFFIATMSYAIPVSSDAHDMGLFLNEFCKNSMSEEEILLKKQNYIEQYFHHPEDYDYIYEIGNGSSYMFLLSELYEVHGEIRDSLTSVMKGNRSATESLDKITPRVEAILDNLK